MYKVKYEISYFPFDQWEHVKSKTYRYKWLAELKVYWWIWWSTLPTHGVLHRAFINNKKRTVGCYD